MSNSKPKSAATRTPTPAPRDPLTAGLAAGGLLLALYLLIAHQTGGVLGCPAGGGCDLVQQSRWSRLWGVSVAAWGAGFYVLLGVVAWWRDLRARFDVLLVLCTVGFAISLYLTFVVWRELRVTCPYCLASLLLVGAASLRAWWRAGGAYRLWLGALAGLLSVFSVAAMHHSFDGFETAFSGPENRYRAALAEHLERSGARFYGASWCPHCQHQKALFGRASKKLPYVECSPHGPGTPQATDCLSAEIRTYPTWLIRDRPYARMLTIAELAALSGFELPVVPAPAQ